MPKEGTSPKEGTPPKKKKRKRIRLFNAFRPANVLETLTANDDNKAIARRIRRWLQTSAALCLGKLDQSPYKVTVRLQGRSHILTIYDGMQILDNVKFRYNARTNRLEYKGKSYKGYLTVERSLTLTQNMTNLRDTVLFNIVYAVKHEIINLKKGK